MLMGAKVEPTQRELDGIPGPDEVYVRLNPPPKRYSDCYGKQEGCQKACRYNTGIAIGRERAGRRYPKERRMLPLWNPALAGCALHLAQQGAMELVEIGDAIGTTGEAVRQTLEKALRKLKSNEQAEHILELIMGGDLKSK